MKAIQLLAVLIVATAEPVFAACTIPDEPVLPNAETAVLPEMMKAAKEVKTYLAAGNKYRECARNDIARDQMVDQMRKVADNFNALTTSFKARSGNNVAAN